MLRDHTEAETATMSLNDSIAEPCRFVLPKGLTNKTADASPTKLSSRKRKRHTIQDERCRRAYELCDLRLKTALETVLQHENDAACRAATEFLVAAEPNRQTELLRTALLVSGEASTDIDRVFKRIASSATDAHLVILRPQDCGSIKAAVRALTVAIIACGTRLHVPTKALSQEIKVLQCWSKLQRQSTLGNKPCVLIGMANVESVSAGVLEFLLGMLTRLDIVDCKLLVNIATSFNDLNDIFTARAAEVMDAQVFNLESGEASTDRLVTELLIDNPSGLCFGPEVFGLIIGDYQNVHRSGDMLIDAMRYASLCHHHANPLSWFVGSDREASLTANECDWIRSLSSVRNHIENLAKSAEAKDIALAEQLIDDDDTLRSMCKEYKDGIIRYRKGLSTAFSVLVILKECLLTSGQTRRRRVDLYRALLSRGLTDSPFVNELLLRIKVVKADALAACLTRILQEVDDLDVRSRFQKMLDTTDQILRMSEGQMAARPAELKKLDSFYRADDKKRGLTPNRAAPKSEYEIRAARTTRGSAISQKAIGDATRDSLTERQQAWTELLDDVHRFCRELFHTNLGNHERLPMYELFWFDAPRCHEAAFRADTRACTRVALAEYEQYLGDDVATPPETSTAFRLFQDSGQLINVFDWSQAFAQQYDQQHQQSTTYDEDHDEDNDDSREEQEQDQGTTLQALFMRSVAELKFLGLFKTTRRKTDHVQKTVMML